MKALTLWQPWASLVAAGGKRLETRSWSTAYRGPLLIHAATREPPTVCAAAFDEEAIQVLGVSDYRTLPRGVVVAIAELVDVRPTETVRQIARREYLFGDYTPAGSRGTCATCGA